jgi:hypothetical protein
MNIATLFAQAHYDPYYYDTGASASYNTQDAGMFLFMMIFVLIFAVVAYVIQALLLGRIFAKAGVPAWKAWVPVYNSWVTLELGGQQGFWAVLAFVPVVNIVSVVFMYIAMYHIGLKLGKEGAFVLLAIFLPIVWYIWLAVDSSTWKGEHAAHAAPAK